ncbi:MAG: branched-chain amino acid transport system ATP-binding protein [Candidatus Eremiobacteraeota bacterium]|nr:branched-chain amino acid transport system ATP-binding protein [Candidatus Eremiobacteraeota bacterium]
MLRTSELTKRFGAHVAVDGVGVEFATRELHAIIGPNGAGKTTLFNLLSGALRPSSGTIEFGGRDVTRLDATDRSRLGMGRSFQRTNVFPKLTVFENVRLAAQSRTASSFALWQTAAALDTVNARAQDVLREFDLLEQRALLASELAGGDQRLLELAITLATDPALLLLDEPSQGLSPEDASRLIDRIGTLARRYTIVLIEHNMPLVMRLAQRITVMSFGRILATGRPEEIRANPDVRAAYLGKRSAP